MTTVNRTEKSISTFHDDDHPPDFFNSANDMRKELYLCDVTLIAENVEIPAHKVILAGSSVYFKNMFSNFTESKMDKVILQEINSEMLKLLIEYMYTSKVDISEENVQNLLVAANFLQLTNVCNRCCQFLEAQLNTTNCLGIQAFADLHGCAELARKAENYVHRYFREVAESEEFLLLSNDEIIQLISSDFISVSSEEKIFEYILKWVKHDINFRKGHLPMLLKYLRIPALPEKYLIKIVVEEPLLKDDEQCKDFILDVLTYCTLRDTTCLTNTHSFKHRKFADSSQLLLAISENLRKSTIQCYDFIEQRWFTMSETSSVSRSCGVTVFDNKVYFMGGWDSAPLTAVHIYDISTRKWSRGVDMIVARSHPGTAVLNNCIYVVGGDDFSDFDYSQTTEMFDPRTQKWSIKSSVSNIGNEFGTGVLNNLIYVAGGYIDHMDLKSVSCYNSETDVWTRVENMPTGRCRTGVAALNGLLYVAGGYGDEDYQNKLEAYDPKTNTWTQLANMNYCRSEFAMVTMNNCLYAIGEDDIKLNGVSSIEIYDPRKNIWTMFPHSMKISGWITYAALIDKPV